jgi:uracil-DNA glycosylase
MNTVGTFPFGRPIIPVEQKERGRKDVFVLGVYASAVHARWIGPDRKTRIRALAVASEPEIFWRGDGAGEIVKSISVPPGAGELKSAGEKYNGPSGRALDELFLDPLGLSRDDTWLCDIVPHSCMNTKQEKALENKYVHAMKELGLPPFDWPPVPKRLSDEKRRAEIESEILESNAKVIITLGDKPLQWFARYYGARGRLGSYGSDFRSYGRLHPMRVGGLDCAILPLVHPRQAGKLGSHSSDWAGQHDVWRRDVAPGLLSA